MKVNLTQLFSLLISVLTSVVHSTCPPNALDKVTECTSSVLPELHQTQTEAPKDYTALVENARETCRDSRLRDVADCIQDIVDRCPGTTDDEQTLRRLIDKDKTLQTVDYFCRHIRVYERHAKCIGDHHDETWSCSSEAHDSFRTKLKAGANMDVLITGSCRFRAVAASCLTNTTDRHCGREAANFVYALMTGLTPPYCETNNPEYRPADTTSSFATERRAGNSDWNSANVLSHQIILFALCLLTAVFL